MAWWPGQLPPRLHERAVRLGTWRPWAQAAEAWAWCTGVTVAVAPVRRLTEGAGAVYEAVPTAAVQTIAQERPAVPPGPRVHRLSVEGAGGPLPQGVGAEVQTGAMAP